MGTWYVLLCLLAVTAGQEGKWRSVDDFSATDGVFMKGELEKFALDFQSRLRDNIEALRQEMYNEFLNKLQQIEDSRQNLSQDITSKLEKQIANVLGKFGKVMKYSSTQVDLVSSKINSLVRSVPKTSLDSLDPLTLAAGEDSLESSVDRKRRGTAHGVPSEVDKELDKPLEDVVDADTLSDFDATEIPAEEEQRLAEIISVGDYFDGHIESQDSDFVLWSQSSPRRQNQYKVSLHRGVSQEEETHPAENSARNDAPRDCYDLLKAGRTRDGVYRIFPQGGGEGVEAWCDLNSDGGGWTHVLRRQPKVPDQEVLNFTKSAEDYVQGFGSPSEEHWLGLENMHHLTANCASTLRVSLINSQLQPSSATYYTFRVGGRADNYRLLLSDYDASSTAGDALTPHSGATFAFPDVELGGAPADENCSATYGVGWWYLAAPECYSTLPTGVRRLQGDTAGVSDVVLGTTKRGLLEWWALQEETQKDRDHTLFSLMMAVRPVLL
ncbi:fibrinogen C domain-containing protein 1-B-like [Penaeus japonicus]|uniref:fibrinogen C domain-containing protein 1-B-like n=1 Tax=Penaeus japonicus TaxID=27405 RepID=UPI001C70D394|nr:fibrinogen C domain-containing protein 1-B-like [Penaeus japonicus]